MKEVYIFKLNRMVTREEYRLISEELKKQISDGMVLMRKGLEFVEHKRKILGATVKIEFVEEENGAKDIRGMKG